ncbi:MAG: glycosyltransferase [Candidatus Nitrospinota bacterium M3_3B_026]
MNAASGPRGARKAALFTDSGIASYAAIGRLYRQTLEAAGATVSEMEAPVSAEEAAAAEKLASGGVALSNTIGPRFSPLVGAYNVALVAHEWSAYPGAWVERLNRFDEVWVTSDHVHDILLRSGLKAPVFKLPPALDIDELPRKESWASSGAFRFLSVGEPHFRKGFHLLMEGFMAAFPEEGEAELVIKTSPGAAWRPPRDDIKIAAERLTLDETLALYKDFDAYVTASLGEGLGLPVAEAVLAGLPVAANFWGGHKSLLVEGAFWRIGHVEIPQPFCSEPSYYAPGQTCAFSSPGEIAKTLGQIREAPPDERRGRAMRAREALLAGYGRETVVETFRKKFGTL